MSLASLPTELIEVIAAYLDLAACRKLRLSCWSLTQKSLHVFRDHYFRTRSLQWTKKDFDQLLEISGHATFGNAMQDLIVDGTPNFAASLWALRKQISEADAIFSNPNGVFFKSELQERYISQEKLANELATFFKETRYDQKSLRAAFASISHLESIKFMYSGMDKSYGKFGRRYCESSQHEMSRPFVSTMTAIAASGIQVRRICTDEHLNYGAVSVRRGESLAPFLRSFDGVFEKLEQLELNLRDWRYPDMGFELGQIRAPFIVRFLAKARNVKHLNLGCYSSLDDDLIREVAHHCTFDRLETCRLSHFRLHRASDIMRLLSPSNGTLVHISLCHMVLWDQETTWADLVRNLASDNDVLPAQEVLWLLKLFTRTGARLRDAIEGWEDIRLGTEGRPSEWREDATIYTQRFSESTSGPAWHLGAVAYPFIGMRT